MNLFVFELKKIFASKRSLSILGLLIVLIALLFTRNIFFQESVEKDIKEDIVKQTRAVQATGRAYAFQLNNNPENEEIKNLQHANTAIRDQLYELAQVPFTNWQERLRFQNKIYEDLLKFKEAGGENPLSVQEINESIALNEQLLQMNLSPEHGTYSIATPNFFLQIVNLLVNFGALLFLLLLIGEMLSGEYEQHSIHLLFSQPVLKVHIITSKFMSAVCMYFTFMMVALITSWTIPSLFGHKGSFAYPLLIESSDEIVFMTIAEYIGKSLILTTVTALLLIALYFLYSLLFKHSLATLTAVIVTLMGGYLISIYTALGDSLWINPFMNLFPKNVLLTEHPQIWYASIPMTILLTFICFLVARKKIQSSYIS